MNKPAINVTPLIDVLLVLLIIFMVVAPLKPSSFKTRLPQEPRKDELAGVNDHVLVAAIQRDGSIRLNSESGLGSDADTSKLTDRLRKIFELRSENNDLAESATEDPGRPFADRVERSVFVKAPLGTEYGRVARLIDAVKSAGAYPISLQIENLEN